VYAQVSQKRPTKGAKETYYACHTSIHLLVVSLNGIGVHNIGEVRDKVIVKLLDTRVVFGVHVFRLNGRDFGQTLERVAAELLVWEKFVE